MEEIDRQFERDLRRGLGESMVAELQRPTLQEGEGLSHVKKEIITKGSSEAAKEEEEEFHLVDYTSTP